ncbi:DEKNAAC104857 [Brettanomyces naardenensis]|uniref:DEKNAAC104857 n=1 Tax=Brettanomyces naardenensis TaxID=13370 RepID=A0A448YSD9_BRENA|nr:DEKNAAC104857 [Brettanomyces naardenensis]
MSEKQRLLKQLRELQEGIDRRREGIRRLLIVKQQQLSKQQEKLKKRIHGNIKPKSIISSRTGNQHEVIEITKKDDHQVQQELLKFRALGRAKKRLFRNVYKNRIKYNYKNRILINELKYVSTDGGNTLALVSTQKENSAPKAELTSIDDLELWITFKGKKYVKDYQANYNLQSKDRIVNPKREECAYYTRSGQCVNPKCRYLHTTGHVALCPSILSTQRRCTNDRCLLSHQPSQFNAPSCKFFQDGACTNANCVYSHKLESGSDTPVCREFVINGYCDKGRECPLRHTFDCPDLQEYGYCLRGRSCHLNHLLAVRTDNTGSNKATGQPTEPIRNVDNDDVLVFFDDSKLSPKEVVDDSLGDKVLRSLSSPAADGERLRQDEGGSQFSRNDDFVPL